MANNDNQKSLSNAFGESLKNWREKRGLSLQELCNETGVSESFILHLETGKRRAPSIPIATRLAEALGIPLSTLTSNIIN